MADEAETEELEPDAPEGQDQPTEAQQAATAEAERLAKLMGWRPESEWKGDKTNWRPAEDFLRETVEVNRGMRTKLQAAEGKLARVVAQVAKLDATTKARMSEEAEQALRQAVEAGDADEAAKILKRVEAQRQPEEPTAYADFKARNADWYGVDDEATAYVATLDARFAAQAGGPQNIADPEAHFRRIEAAMKKRFPELFEEEADDTPHRRKEPEEEKGNARRTPLVARGNGRAETPSRGGKVTAATLTREQREAAALYNITPEAYAEQWNRAMESGQ